MHDALQRYRHEYWIRRNEKSPVDFHLRGFFYVMAER